MPTNPYDGPPLAVPWPMPDVANRYDPFQTVELTPQNPTPNDFVDARTAELDDRVAKLEQAVARLERSLETVKTILAARKEAS